MESLGKCRIRGNNKNKRTVNGKGRESLGE